MGCIQGKTLVKAEKKSPKSSLTSLNEKRFDNFYNCNFRKTKDTDDEIFRKQTENQKELEANLGKKVYLINVSENDGISVESKIYNQLSLINKIMVEKEN